MSHYTVHPTTDGKWLVSEGNSPMINAATEHSANIIATAMEKAHGHNPLNQLPVELRPLAVSFIHILKGLQMALDPTSGNNLLAQGQKLLTDAQAAIAANTASDQAVFDNSNAAVSEVMTQVDAVVNPAPVVAPAPAPATPPAA